MNAAYNCPVKLTIVGPTRDQAFYPPSRVSEWADRGWEASIQVATLSLCRFARREDRLWAFVQMGAARPALARAAGLEFWKLCGSGTGEGFTPRPNTAVWGILGTWRDLDAAVTGLKEPPFVNWRRRAAESWSVFLSPFSARGSWSGRTPFHSGTSRAGPVAVLTRATIRPRAMLKFWQSEPAISEVVGRDPNILFKIGIGEVPWRNQVTFSIWPSVDAMERFAHRGPHAAAIRAVRRGGWFAEELYARFAVIRTMGTWGGSCPLTPDDDIAA
jgi:spheroidene monooxygenase